MESERKVPVGTRKNLKRGSKKKTKSRLTAAAVFYAILTVIIGVFVYEGIVYFMFINSSLKYWSVCIKEWNTNGNLRTMDRIFDQLNYTSVNGSNGDVWDVVWSIEYPYWEDYEEVFKPLYKPLKSHQRVNHFPGMNYITKKAFLNSMNNDLPYILKSFEFPLMIKEFKEFIKNNPNKKIIEKDIYEGDVKIVALKDVKFATTKKFYQEFMDKPLLIDNRAFDIGVYVLITSIDPLRIYRFDSEIKLRFCHQPYHPFNKQIVDKYVVNENHDHFFEIPSMKKSFEKERVSYKKAFEDYLSNSGHSVKFLQGQIDDAIISILQRNEVNLVSETKKLYDSARNFFELVRFDFIVDEKLKAYLVEVNNSPNLTPELDRFYEAAANEKLVHEVITLIGAESRQELMASYGLPSNEMESALDLEFCLRNNCQQNCKQSECRICLPCATDDNERNIYQAYREHTRRGGFKRIYPSTWNFAEDFIATLTPKNQVASKWFKEKCNENKEWC